MASSMPRVALDSIFKHVVSPCAAISGSNVVLADVANLSGDLFQLIVSVGVVEQLITFV